MTEDDLESYWAAVRPPKAKDPDPLRAMYTDMKLTIGGIEVPGIQSINYRDRLLAARPMPLPHDVDHWRVFWA